MKEIEINKMDLHSVSPEIGPLGKVEFQPHLFIGPNIPGPFTIKEPSVESNAPVKGDDYVTDAELKLMERVHEYDNKSIAQVAKKLNISQNMVKQMRTAYRFYKVGYFRNYHEIIELRAQLRAKEIVEKPKPFVVFPDQKRKKFLGLF